MIGESKVGLAWHLAWRFLTIDELGLSGASWVASFLALSHATMSSAKRLCSLEAGLASTMIHMQLKSIRTSFYSMFLVFYAPQNEDFGSRNKSHVGKSINNKSQDFHDNAPKIDSNGPIRYLFGG